MTQPDFRSGTEPAFRSGTEPAFRSGTEPVLYRTTIEHERRVPVHHRFRYRHVMWLVDIDSLPTLPRTLRFLARFEPGDHLHDAGPHHGEGGEQPSLRARLDAYLAEHDLDVEGGRVLMLTNPRSCGFVFNPLTLYWCYQRSGALACVVAEVHNTHGDRHCYLLHPDANGCAEVDKSFYVSPFFAVDGRYEMLVSEPGPHLDLSITLRRGENMEPVFRASLHGRRTAERVRSSSRAAARYAGGSWRVIALIRWQGVLLWLRRVPIVPRPAAAVSRPVAHQARSPGGQGSVRGRG